MSENVFVIASRKRQNPVLATVTFVGEDGDSRDVQFVAPTLEAMDGIATAQGNRFKFSKHVYSVLVAAAKPLQPDIDEAWFRERLDTTNLPVITKVMDLLLPNESKEDEEEVGGEE